MGRPSIESGVEAVEGRISKAFWHLHGSRSIEQVTVQDIARTAGCNRATFYRHYGGIQDLLEAIEDSLIPVELPKMVLGALSDAEGQGALDLSKYLTKEESRFRRIALLLGPTGDPAFGDRLRTAMIIEWSRILRAEPSGFGDRQVLLFRFLAGGIFAMLSYWSEKLTQMPFQQFVQTYLLEAFSEQLPAFQALLAQTNFDQA